MDHQGDSDASKLFVGGLNRSTTSDGLKSYFEKFGPLKDCVVMYDPEGKSRCFGFVTFENAPVVDMVLKKTHILDKKQVCRHVPLLFIP